MRTSLRTIQCAPMEQGMASRRSDSPPASLERIRKVLLLDRAGSTLLSLILVAALAIAVGWGCAMLALARHFTSLRDAGEGLTALTALLAEGTSAITILPGWIAAGCFALALLRLRRGVAEPPVTRSDPAELSVTELRAALRREFRAVGVALLAIVALALLDAGRLIVFTAAALGGDGLARGTLGTLALETAGLAVAAIVLGLWADAFRTQLERFGAL